MNQTTIGRMGGLGLFVLGMAVQGNPQSALAGGQAEPQYTFKVVAEGLHQPTGIVASHPGVLFITQLPTPGVAGGDNTVDMLHLRSGKMYNLTRGEPEPTNLALDKRGVLYWTCKSAGVILKYDLQGEVSLVLQGLQSPSGIATDRAGNLYFTQLPTPGVGGGMNTVDVFDGLQVMTLTMGEPEPTDVTSTPEGHLYWTCKSAGVILHRPPGGAKALLLDGLMQPVGISVDHQGRYLYFTEVPTPGVAGGMNRVNRLNLSTGERQVIHEGDPEPADVAVSPNGNVYWTCTTAGVIVEAKP